MYLQNKTSKKKKKNNKTTKPHIIITISMIKGFLISGILLIIFAIMLTFLSLPHFLIDNLSLLSICIGTAITSFQTTKQIRKKGIFFGFICSISIYLVLFIFSLVFKTLGNYPAHITKFIIIVLVSLIFGIIGVNKRCKNDFK